MKRTLVSLAVAASCLALLPHRALAQSKGADLSGVVRDSTGAAMARVTVTVRHLATNHTRQAVSDDHGRYAFRELEVGSHEVTAESAGFRPARLLADLSIGQNAEANIVLAPGTMAESVEVTATQPGLGVETRSSTYGTLVTQKQIETLPLNGRDFSQLILLQPGTAQARSDQGDILTGKGAKISVHGARTSQNAYMLDGTDILDALGRNAASAQGLVLLIVGVLLAAVQFGVIERRVHYR